MTRTPLVSPKKQLPPEMQAQKDAVEVLERSLLPPARVVYVPNGHFLKEPSVKQLGLFCAMGGKSGFPDLAIFWPGPRFGLIEMKSAKGRLQLNQKEWRAWAQAMGIPWGLARSSDDALALARGWGVPMRSVQLLGAAT